MKFTRPVASYAVVAFALIAVACSAQPSETDSMDVIAERYVKLVLAVGQHDADYVDAYYGPAEWKEDADRAKIPLAEIAAEAERVSLKAGEPSGYNLGKDFVKEFIESRGGVQPEKRWEEFVRLLASPRLPSGLRVR